MKKRLHAGKQIAVFRRPVIAMLVLSVFWMSVSMGCSRNQDSESKESGGATPDPIYVPGTYQGSAKGYGGIIRVTVEVDENHILSMEAVGNDETDGIGKVALEKLPQQIIAANGTDIDGMTGATYSSQGLFEAVNDALSQAYSGE